MDSYRTASAVDAGPHDSRILRCAHRVSQQREVADLAPAECAHQDVQFPVPIEIGGANVGDPWKPAVRMRLGTHRS